ncbi:MAG: FAD-dependent oxidoreductase [Nanoarchaeota archaeon]|nr:FAD-dependent oxidoreductase [Nanoarchaeota archaeon]
MFTGKMAYACKLTEFVGEVTAIVQETHDVKTIRVTVPEDFSFIPGQFFMLSIPGHPDFDAVQKPLTFANSPNTKEVIEFTFKKMGAFTSALNDLIKGDKLKLKAPCGRLLNFDENIKKDVVFLAGGTGITPFMSSLKYAFEEKMSNNFVLFFGNQSPKDIIYEKKLEKMAREHDNLKVINTVVEPDSDWDGETGFISKKIVLKYIKKEPKEYIWYICGPPAMNAAMKTMLAELNVDDNQIRIDPWELPGKSTDQ